MVRHLSKASLPDHLRPIRVPHLIHPQLEPTPSARLMSFQVNYVFSNASGMMIMYSRSLKVFEPGVASVGWLCCLWQRARAADPSGSSNQGLRAWGLGSTCMARGQWPWSSVLACYSVFLWSCSHCRSTGSRLWFLHRSKEHNVVQVVISFGEWTRLPRALRGPRCCQH